MRDRLARRGVDLINPHRKNRVRTKKQYGRRLRRYHRRCKIKRSFSWLHDFRRLVMRHEFCASIYYAFAKLACIIIALRRF